MKQKPVHRRAVAIKKAAAPTSQFVQMGYSPPKKLGSLEDGVDCHCPCHLKYEKVEQHISSTLIIIYHHQVEVQSIWKAALTASNLSSAWIPIPIIHWQHRKALRSLG